MPSAALTPAWVPHPRYSPEAAAALAKALGAPLPVAHALVNRGIDDAGKADAFLSPAIENLHDPAEMLDLERAAQRILDAVAKGERIFVQGDYDVDGITSTFLLYSVLLEIGGKAEYRIPDRKKDGYGLTEKAIDEAHRLGCTLVVTVDCGITATEPVAYARTLGIDTVITDHHEPPAVLPDAYAIVNPLRPGCPYPFKALAGVGVTFKLAERLLAEHGGLDRAREYLDVVALGTIADVVPLVGENRVLARLGLDQLNLGKRIGLIELASIAGISGKRIHSSQVAFVLAPRINAAGRMGNARQGMLLLLEREVQAARAIAQSLEEENNRRREADEKVREEAAKRVETELGYPECSSIVLWSADWPPGVIGIVASRLVERFQRPTVLISLEVDPARGSGRSLPGLDLTRLLDECGDLLIAHGGHAFAAGLTIATDKLEEFRTRLEALVRSSHRPDQFVQQIPIDHAITLAECDLDLVEWLERMSPHGLDNPEPVFSVNDAIVQSFAQVGNGKHLRLTVRDTTGSAEAIGFGLGAIANDLRPGARVNLAFVPTRNEWKNETRVQLKLKDVRLP